MTRGQIIRYFFLLLLALGYLFLPGEEAHPATGIFANAEIFAKAQLLRSLFLYVVVGSIAGLIIAREVAEHFHQGLERAADRFALEIKAGVQKSLGDGLKDMGAIVADQVGRSLPGAFRPTFEEKTLPQAIAAIPQRSITKLVDSGKRSDWDEAFELLKKTNIADPADCLPLAYRYWQAGLLDMAIEVAEFSLAKAAPERQIKLKNSLAYYLAQRQLPKDAERARQLAMEAAHEFAEPRAKALNTQGYVEISFAENEEQLKVGIALCNQALARGGKLDVYNSAMARAAIRTTEIAALQAKVSPSGAGEASGA